MTSYCQTLTLSTRSMDNLFKAFRILAGNIDAFVEACEFNDVKKVRRIISEGVDINGGNRHSETGLMRAMSHGHMKIVELLLSCEDIKIDIQNSIGLTALHWACNNNQVKSVKLYLDHPSCTKEIVEKMENNGMTAEMVAYENGFPDCVRLVKNFTTIKQEDDRSVDDLVEFINGGGTEKKKNKKKRKNPVQPATKSQNISSSGGNNSKTVNIDVKGINDDLKTKDNDDSGFQGQSIDNSHIRFDPEILIHREVSENVHSKSDVGQKATEELEQSIAEKRVHLDAQNKNIHDIIDTKRAKIKDLDSMIEKSHNEKIVKMSQVDMLDRELSDLETKIAKIKLRKSELLEESKNDDKKIQKYENKKSKVESDFDTKLRIQREKGKSIKNEILYLERKLEETEKSTQNFPDTIKPSFEPNEDFLKFIDNQISEKEKELECPVCLEVACSPIFMCSEQHLICSNCRPKLSNCPECREVYTGRHRRHRYAEKTAEELERLKNKKDQVRKYSNLNHKF